MNDDALTQSQQRYEIFEQIAAGDFATVYRGKDRELGREVAVKQIHPHFLTDPKQLERYWQEAQLLASLEHRNIMTIYDLVRGRGWLILELMYSSLAQLSGGRPMDLDFLRVALACSLQGLRFLHENGIIHGDIKPSNLFVDKRYWVKLGDFGLARRVSNDQGSLLKGTTRYMAPELVSNQFGPVGPASDLYSLGFSLYELMCGAQFESLFPGLEAFGRDKQIAWMMWHAAPDRRLPPIGRVLEGVPDDLANIIQKLVAKNPAERYRTADEALADLKTKMNLVDPTPDPNAKSAAEAAEELRRKKKRKWILAGSGFVLSSTLAIVLSAVFAPEPPPAPVVAAPATTRGVIRYLLPEKQTMVLEVEGAEAPREFVVREKDRVFLNNTPSLLRELKDGDRITIETLKDDAGKSFSNIAASRPQRNQGVIKEVKGEDGKLSIALDGDSKGGSLTISVPLTVKIRFNNQPQIAGRAVTLADLLPGDQVAVDHDGGDGGRVATSLSVLRGVPVKGVVRAIDAAKGVTVALGKENDAQLESWPFAPNCEITLNGRRFIDSQLLKPADLKPGDEVSLVHDTSALRIDAYRTFRKSGVVQNVRNVDHALELAITGETAPLLCTLGPQCKITLGGEQVLLSDLHRGDQATVMHDSPDSKSAEVVLVEAVRPVDNRCWAIVIAEQTYEDSGVSRPAFAAADGELLLKTLTGRYQVNPEQVLALTDPSRVRLEQSLATFLGKVPADAQLLCYFAGQAYAGPEGNIYVAPKDFSLERMETTGLALRWLIGELEKSPVRDKLLLWDASHAGKGADLKQQPSSAEMLNSLLETGAKSPLRSLIAIASCAAGQRGQDLPDKQHGRFAWALAEGFSGKADKNQDNRVEPTELFEYLSTVMSTGAGPASRQTPMLILPDDTPARLSEDAKKAIRKLASQIEQTQVSWTQAESDAAAARVLAGKQPEARLLHGLLLLKGKKEAEALKSFEELKLEFPDLLLPAAADAWLRFRKQNYTQGIGDLVQLAGKISKLKDVPPAEMEYLERLLEWCGRMREYSASAAAEARRPAEKVLSQLDAAVKQCPARLRASYNNGRNEVRKVALDFDRKIGEEAGEAAILKLQVNRRQMSAYVSFPVEESAQQILGGIDR